MFNKFISKIRNLFNKNSDSDEESIDLLSILLKDSVYELDDSDEYPISQYKAFCIANQPQNLKSDYCKLDDRRITYIDFTHCKVELIDYNNEQYWHIKIINGDVSWVKFDDDDEFNTTFCDGPFLEDDFKKLQCLVNVNNGTYLYYPSAD